MVTDTAAAANILLDSEMDGPIQTDPTLGWDANANTTTVFSGGTCTVTNTNSGTSAQIVQNQAIVNGTDYYLIIKCRNAPARCNIFVSSDTANPGTSADLVSSEKPDHSTLTEVTYGPFTGTATNRAYVTLRVYSTSIGQGFEVDYCRIVEA